MHWAMEMRNYDADKEYNVSTKKTYMNALQFYLRVAEKQWLLSFSDTDSIPKRLLNTNEFTWTTDRILKDIPKLHTKFQIELAKLGRTKLNRSTRQNGQLIYKQYRILKEFFEWYTHEMHERCSNRQHPKHKQPMYLFDEKTPSAAHEYIVAVQTHLVLTMTLYGCGRAKESFSNLYIDDITLVKNKKGKAVAFWVIPDLKTEGKTIRHDKKGNIIVRYPYLVLCPIAAQQMEFLLNKRPSSEGAAPGDGANKVFIQPLRNSNMSIFWTVLFKLYGRNKFINLNKAIHHIKQTSKKWPFEESGDITLGSIRVCMTEFYIRWFGSVDSILAMVLQGKTPKHGMSHYSKSIGRNLEDVLRYAVCLKDPEVYQFNSKIDAKYLRFFFDQLPAGLALTRAECVTILSGRHVKPMTFDECYETFHLPPVADVFDAISTNCYTSASDYSDSEEPEKPKHPVKHRLSPGSDSDCVMKKSRGKDSDDDEDYYD
mmetsp:Transcript_19772/g.23536  ORF Transcript_19772/g.23536 Transcript_19772/m.23536 type:complete len:485 (+) Transcript_19772:398-1852(+)